VFSCFSFALGVGTVIRRPGRSVGVRPRVSARTKSRLGFRGSRYGADFRPTKPGTENGDAQSITEFRSGLFGPECGPGFGACNGAGKRLWCCEPAGRAAVPRSGAHAAPGRGTVPAAAAQAGVPGRSGGRLGGAAADLGGARCRQRAPRAGRARATERASVARHLQCAWKGSGTRGRSRGRPARLAGHGFPGRSTFADSMPGASDASPDGMRPWLP